MTYTVTVSEFRQNLSHYLELLRNKAKVSVTDGRKGKVLVELVGDKTEEFDWDSYLKKIEGLRGSSLIRDTDMKNMKKFRQDIDKRLQTQ